MKKIAIALVAVLAIWAIYKLKYPTYTYRYRMTVEIDAGGEVRSSSTVIEVRASRQPQFLPEVGPYDRSAKGQAVFVELPDGKNIVALLASGSTAQNWDYPVQIVHRVFKVEIDGVEGLSGRRELTIDQMPTLITVTNPNDAKTIRVMKPDQLDNLMGVHLRSISIELTKDPVSTINIDARLPFLVDQEKERLQYGLDGVHPSAPFFLRR